MLDGGHTRLGAGASAAGHRREVAASADEDASATAQGQAGLFSTIIKGIREVKRELVALQVHVCLCAMRPALAYSGAAEP